MSATAPAIAPAATTTWSIDPAHSSIEFSVRHLMISSVKGRFTDVRGGVTTTGDELATGTVDVTIGAASIDTRVADRDAHLRSADFFETDKFPEITFRSRSIARVGGEALKLIGDLTIRGISREIVLDVESHGRGKDPWGGERAGFSASGRIKRSEFGLTWNQALEAGGVVVSDDIKIVIDTELVKQT